MDHIYIKLFIYRPKMSLNLSNLKKKNNKKSMKNIINKQLMSFYKSTTIFKFLSIINKNIIKI